MTGRGAEFGLLHTALDLARDGKGGLAVVHGEPGIGKSRLVTELAIAAAATMWVSTGATPDLPSAPLTPWAEICRSLVKRLPSLPDQPWVGGLAPLLPAHLPSARPGPPGLEQARLFEAVVALVDHAAAHCPQLLVLEDLHAADEASLELLAYLCRRIGEIPVLITATRRERPSRDHLATLEHSRRQSGQLLADVPLGPLTDGEIAGLAGALAPLPQAALDMVVRAADGNALLAVEAARALSSGEDLPVGLRGAVRAAMARLTPQARELVQAVSVVGRALPAEHVATLVGAPGGAGNSAAVADALNAAEDEGLLVSTEAGIGFRHALLRDASYSDIPVVRRRKSHAAAAKLLIDQGYGAVEAAAHLRAAGESAQAGELLIQAAAVARGLGALADVTELLRQAVAALPDDPRPALELADVLAWRGRRADAGTAFARVMELLEAAGDPVALARAHIRFAEWHYGPICQPRIALDACRRALAVLDAAGLREVSTRSQVLAAMVWCESLAGDPEDVDTALSALESISAGQPLDPLLTCGTQRARSFVLLRQGRFLEAVEPGLLAAQAGREAERPDLVYVALVNAAYGLAASGDLGRALELIDSAATAIRGLGMLAIETRVLVDRAWLLARRAEFAAAAAALQQARRLTDRLAAPDLQALVDAEAARVALRTGDYSKAESLMQQALSFGDATIGRPLARLQRAEALARMGSVDAARSELRAMVTEPVGPGDWPDTLVARMAGVQGLIAQASGDIAGARMRFTESCQGWRRRIDPQELADRMAAVLADLGRPIIGLVVPAEELAMVEADLAALDGLARSGSRLAKV